ncbi:MAG: hypothetical protein HAW63_03295 [Bdellovibrionaceae bacterium]|nr:hypothetical protein [Pseudobdellovibrionaceae bacterium]
MTNLHNLLTKEKALEINKDSKPYGTFAEIGAGQEVARHFFQAGLSSHTIAKTMSAYDMSLSDEIYGESPRYVCADRVKKMLQYEYDLLVTRLSKTRGDKTQFFSYANTVTTTNSSNKNSHGWMGFCFQEKEGSLPSKVIIHLKLHHAQRLVQQTEIGTLGVNLIYNSLYKRENLSEFISSLKDNLHSTVEIDYIDFTGTAFSHIDNRTANLELIENHWTKSVVFTPDGSILPAEEVFFDKSLLIMQGTYRPITKANLEILNQSKQHFKSIFAVKNEEVVPVLEMNLGQKDGMDYADILNRIDTLAATNNYTLVSKFNVMHELKAYIRNVSAKPLAFVIGASFLENLFNESSYKNLEGSLLEAMGKLFDENTKVLVFPYKRKDLCVTSKSFSPKEKYCYLYKYLLEQQFITDISVCEDVDISILSEDVRKLLKTSDASWSQFVPEEVVKLIKAKNLFQ